MKKLVIVFASCLVAFSGFAQNLTVIEPDFKNVRYAEARPEFIPEVSNSDRVLDIYLPKSAKPSKGYPTVVFIHGGGFANGTKAMVKSNAAYFNTLLENGYAIVSVDYMLAKKLNKYLVDKGQKPAFEFKSPDKYESATNIASEDALLALQFLSKKGKKYSLDISRMAISGGSAGSMTCLHLAFVRHPQKPAIRGVINMWGSIAKTEWITDPNIPVLTFHGDKDKTVAYSNAVKINKRLEEIGSKGCKFITMEGKGHAQYANVGENYMKDVLEFLSQVLKK